MIKKIASRNFLINTLIVLLIFLIDRISKNYVINLYKESLDPKIFSSIYLDISLIWNEGVAFGLLSFNDQSVYNILSIVILIFILLIFYMANKNEGLKKYSLFMILGGALGNFYDRLIYNAVPDFLDFHIGNFHWFIFNVADIFITFGVIFVIISEMMLKESNNL